MSDTFASVKGNSELEWRYELAKILVDIERSSITRRNIPEESLYCWFYNSICVVENDLERCAKWISVLSADGSSWGQVDEDALTKIQSSMQSEFQDVSKAFKDIQAEMKVLKDAKTDQVMWLTELINLKINKIEELKCFIKEESSQQLAERKDSMKQIEELKIMMKDIQAQLQILMNAKK